MFCQAVVCTQCLFLYPLNEPKAMRVLLFLILLFSPLLSFAADLDSLLNRLEYEGDPNKRFTLLNEISDEYSHFDLDKSTSYALQWFDEAREAQNKAHMGRALSRYGDILLHKGKKDSALTVMQQSVEILSDFPDLLGLYQAKIILARAHSQQLQYYQSIEQLNQSIDYLDEHKNKSHHYEITRANAHHEKGKVFDLLGESEKGISHLRKARKVYAEQGDLEGLANTLLLIGGFHFNQQHWDSALHYFTMADQIYTSQNWERYQVTATNNIGSVYLEKGSLDSAKTMFTEVLNQSESYNDLNAKCLALNNLAEVHLRQGDLDRAMELSEECVKLVEDKKIDNPYTLFPAYEVLYKVHRVKGDFEEALQYFEKHQAINDSLRSEKNITEVSILESRIKAEQQIKENKLLKETLQKEKEVVDLQTAALMLIFLLVIGSTIALIYFRRNNRKLEEKSVRLEEESTKLELAVDEINSINNNLEEVIEKRTRELTQANKRLRTSERKARLSEFTIESSDFAVFWINSRGQFIRTNEACELLMGYDQRELQSLRTKDIYAEEDMPGFSKYWSLVKSERYYPWELRLQRKDGREIWVETFSHYITFDNEEYICGFARDISDRKIREEEIARRYEFESLLARISNRLLKTPSGKVEAAIEDALSQVNEVLNSDRAFVTILSKDRTSYRVAFGEGVHNEKLSELIKEGRPIKFKGHYISEHLVNDKSVIFQDVEELGSELQIEKDTLSNQGVRSLILVPGSIKDEIYIAIGVHMLRIAREWTREEENMLRIVGEMLASALARNQKEDSLRESERRLQLALQAGNEAIWDWNMETGEMFASEEFYTMIGYEEGEFERTLENFTKSIYQSDRKLFESVFENFVSGRQDTYELNYRMVRTNGQIMWVNSRGIIKDRYPDGKPRGITGTITDITERKTAEIDLERLNVRLENLIDNLPGIVYRSRNDDKWTMEFISNSVKEITGYNPEEFTSTDNPRGWRSIIHPDDREFDNPEILESLEGYGRYQYTYRVIAKNKDVKWCLEQGVAIRNDRGEITEFEGYIIDITDKMKAEDKIIATVLETEDKERRRIAKELHDSLGQTLTAASLNINSIKKEIPKLSEKLQLKYNKTQELLRQAIKESRDISHNIMPKDIDDFGFALATQSLMDGLSDATDVDFHFYENLNKTRLSAFLELNLFRVTQEAINNSLKYANAKNITVQLMKHDDMLILTVEDDGRGFNLESLKKETTSLGISNMRNRANAMSGEFTIDSSKSRGTIITVQISLQNEQVPNSTVFSR
jgi:PAS domain S-box-containing protein